MPNYTEDYLRACQSLSDSINRFCCYLENTYTVDYVESVWLAAVFIHALPSFIEGDLTVKIALLEKVASIKGGRDC
ncbi:MAG: hypothetical protein ACRC78_05425 [Planktothrix sp.]